MLIYWTFTAKGPTHLCTHMHVRIPDTRAVDCPRHRFFLVRAGTARAHNSRCCSARSVAAAASPQNALALAGASDLAPQCTRRVPPHAHAFVNRSACNRNKVKLRSAGGAGHGTRTSVGSGRPRARTCTCHVHLYQHRYVHTYDTPSSAVACRVQYCRTHIYKS